MVKNDVQSKNPFGLLPVFVGLVQQYLRIAIYLFVHPAI